MRTATFPVVLAAAVPRNTTVYFSTLDGTPNAILRIAPAIAGVDYTASSGTVVIPAGQLQTFVSVQVRDDNPDVPQSQFFLKISAGNGAVVAVSQAKAIIPGLIVGDFAFSDFGSQFSGGAS